jgi:alpha-1,2-mannosidase, putative
MSSAFNPDLGANGRTSLRPNGVLRPISSASSTRSRAYRSAPTPSLADEVNTFQGTDSYHGFSTGNTLPLAVAPHGMIAWSPQTDEGRWVFDYRAARIQGFRGTHQPSPWMGDYGHFLVMPATGPKPPTSVADSESSYRKTDTVARPHYFRTRLLRHDILAELTPTERGACFRFTYRGDQPAWLAFKLAEGEVLHVDRARRLVYGISTSNQGGVPKNFGCHFVAEIGAPILGTGRFDTPVTTSDRSGTTIGAWLKLRLPANGVVTVKIATSFISRDQALLNLRRELGSRSFDSLRSAAQTAWDRRLAVIALDGATDEQRRTFYSCLYRCFQFPRQWHEFDAAGKRVHYSPHDGRVYPGPFYTDSGFWDIYRALLPLLTILDPDLVGDMIEGWLNTYREGGWLPNWLCPGYRACMVGSHSPTVFADAFLKGIRNFDAATAYAAVRHDATCVSPAPDRGRFGLAHYLRLGFVPSDRVDHSVARTTDYAHADFGAAQLAAALGHSDDAREFAHRAGHYRHVYDPRTGFFRGRLANGKWREPFREFEWSIDYIEGSAWQHTWAAPHDIAGLIKLMGGRRKFVAKLDRMLALPPRFETGRYSHEIHEMTEMAAIDFGQYAHSNEPVHHVLYLYTYAGRPDRTQYWVRRTLDELYSPQRLPGDEDNGSMAAWYVLSALGLYPVAVGHPSYVLGAPRFPRATLRLPDGNTFVIEAEGDVSTACYTAGVVLNDRPHDSLELSHAAIAAGGRITFHLTDQPRVAAARGRLSPPFSLSTHGLSSVAGSTAPAASANGKSAISAKRPRVAQPPLTPLV